MFHFSHWKKRNGKCVMIVQVDGFKRHMLIFTPARVVQVAGRKSTALISIDRRCFSCCGLVLRSLSGWVLLCRLKVVCSSWASFGTIHLAVSPLETCQTLSFESLPFPPLSLFPSSVPCPSLRSSSPCLVVCPLPFGQFLWLCPHPRHCQHCPMQSCRLPCP